ncbi:hypothetical protein [Rhodococcus koreensis]
MKKAAIGASALVAIATVAGACSPEDTESRDPTVFVQSTQFAPPPTPITDLVPTAEQLTALYNATTNYSIREEDRALLLDGPSDQTLPIARAWGAQPSPQYSSSPPWNPSAQRWSTRLGRVTSKAWNLTRWDQFPSCVSTTSGSYPAPSSVADCFSPHHRSAAEAFARHAQPVYSDW